MTKRLGLLVTFAATVGLAWSLRRDRPPRRLRRPWRSALALGAASSSFSTLAVTLGARRIGRDPAVDWMEVATVALGRRPVRERPSRASQAGGILVHQGADLLWALVFFGALAPWSARLSPARILAAVPAWAAVTASIEFHLVLPWLRPLLPMQVPYGVASCVHLLSGAAYPLFPLFDPEAPSADRRFARRWSRLLAAALGGLLALEVASRLGREPPIGRRRLAPGDPDARFLHHMTRHHEVGLFLARMAAERAHDPELAALARLMAAEHAAEIDLMRRWWRSWLEGAVPPLPPSVYEDMVGMPPVATLRALEVREAPFDAAWLRVMLRHHEGALVMVREELARGGVLQVRLLARAIDHAQRRQMEAMRDLLRRAARDGSAAVPFSW